MRLRKKENGWRAYNQPDNCTIQQKAIGELKKQQTWSVPVGVSLERASNLHTNVVSLLFRQLGQLGTEGWQMKSRDFLVQLFRQEVHLVLVRLGLLPVLQEVK